MVEFAILAPVLVLLLVGLIDIGRYTYYSILAANAAHAGAQYGAQNTTKALDNTGMQNAALNDGQNLSQWGVPNATHYCTLNGTVTGCPGTNATPAPGELYYVQVQVTGTFNPLVPYPGIPKNLQVSGNAVMRVASQ